MNTQVVFVVLTAGFFSPSLATAQQPAAPAPAATDAPPIAAQQSPPAPPVPVPPSAVSVRRRNPTMMYAGIVLASLGVVGVTAGGIAMASAPSGRDMGDVAKIAGFFGGIVGGGLFFLVPGVVLTAVGASTVPEPTAKVVARTLTWLPPSVAVGPGAGSVSLRWAF